MILHDQKIIDSMAGSIAFYMCELDRTDISLEGIREYYKEWERYDRSIISSYLNYIWHNRDDLFMKDRQIGYSDKSRDFFINDLIQYFEKAD